MKVSSLLDRYKQFTEEQLRNQLAQIIEESFLENSNKQILKTHSDAIFLAMKLKGIDYGQDSTAYHKLIE